MFRKLSQRALLQSLRILVLSSMLMLSFAGAIQPASAIVWGIGMVGGDPDDMGFNYAAHQGLIAAGTALGATTTYYETLNPDNYQATLEQCASEGNALCFAVGFAFGDAVVNAANNWPGTKFAILDYEPASYPSNLRGIRFNEKEAGYLAGALAGRMSATKIVGVVGGMEAVPAVVAFVEGYRNGAQCANQKVKVLVRYAGTFTDPTLGATLADWMMDRGADVVFGAAGPTGNGSILYAAQHGKWSIGVDTDQFLNVFGDGTVLGHEKLLTSAIKDLENAVVETAQDYYDGVFTSGTVVYDLSMDGVGLAPYHDAEASIPAATKTYIEQVKAGIIAGAIDVDQTCRYTGKSVGTSDGYVLESAENNETGGSKNSAATYFIVGDDAQDRQYRSILSFNTGSLPDNAVVTKIVLRIRKAGLVGTNPFTTHGTIRVDIRRGPFAANSSLQITDFQAAAHKNSVASFTNSPLSGGWYQVILPATAYPYINRTGVTQFRLRFAAGDNDDMSADLLKFFSGNASLADRPQLIISYTWP